MPIPIRTTISRMRPYPPGKPIEEVQRELGLTEIIKLASNENPMGPSPAAVQAIKDHLDGVHIYPDARCWTLRSKLADKFDIDPDQVLIANGSDQIIGLLGTIFLEKGTNLVMGDPSFMRYDSAALANEADLIKVPLTKDWVHDLDAMADAVSDQTRLVFVANPNNPTGTSVTKAGLERFLDRLPDHIVVVLDEAYFEFAQFDGSDTDGLEYVKAGRQVIALRTMSKAHGLAGLRIGYGFAAKEVATAFQALRPPFDVNQLALAAATAAIDDKAHLERTLQNNTIQKTRFSAKMAEMGLATVPSHANFVCVDLGRPDLPVCDALLRQGVIVRPGTALGMPGFLRVSLGTTSEMDKFFAALETALNLEPATP